MGALARRGIAGSPIRSIFDRARELEAAGRSIVHLEIGRPHLDSPASAKRAASAALERGDVHYTPNRGVAELREAIAARLAGRGTPYDPAAEVVVTAGGSEAVAAAFLSRLDPRDEVLICEPAWPHYAPQVLLAGGVPVGVPCAADDGFVPNPDRVAAAIGGRTRALVVSSPCNPTGAVWPADRLAGLADLCLRHDLWALSDEIYAEFVYGPEPHTSIAAIAGMRERTVVADSFSKAWSMTGWRVGYAAGPTAWMEELNTVHQYLTVCAPSFAQAGAAAALADGQAVAAMVDEYAARRRELVAGLRDIERVELVEPQGAFYALPRIGAGRTGDDALLARDLLEEAGVAVVPGAVFGAGCADHVRLSYAVAQEELAEGLARISRFLAGSA